MWFEVGTTSDNRFLPSFAARRAASPPPGEGGASGSGALFRGGEEEDVEGIGSGNGVFAGKLVEVGEVAKVDDAEVIAGEAGCTNRTGPPSPPSISLPRNVESSSP